MGKKEPKDSVINSIYSKVAYVHQTLQELKIITINNGSANYGRVIIQELTSLSPQKRTFFSGNSRKNKGLFIRDADISHILGCFCAINPNLISFLEQATLVCSRKAFSFFFSKNINCSTPITIY